MTANLQSFSKHLSSLMAGIISLPDEYDVEFNDIVLDSRQVKQGDVFVAVTGDGTNGLDYIDTAISNGAVAVLWEARVDAIPYAWSTVNKKVPLIAITNLKLILGQLANRAYNKPSEILNIVGVTGTNGKTSCVNYIAQALGADMPCGLIGTLGTGIYPNISAGSHTTPDVLTVHKTLAHFVDSNARFAAIEVSSHALAQGRIDDVEMAVAIFTNLSQDHLDYHGTMQAYLKEKAKLFQRSTLKTAIVNLYDPYGLDIVQAAQGKNIITYSLDEKNKADVYASSIQYQPDCTKFVLNTKQGAVLISSSLVGDFNVSNLLAVCAYLYVLGFSLEEIAARIKKVSPVAGRMQKVIADGYPMIIVDYAHTPDALEHVLQTLSAHFKNNLTCVFGCGGERDTDKRSKMGEVADVYSDTIVLTNDNPRNESAENIIAQINKGITNKRKVITELDRKDAISKAIEMTNAKGCVLIAGKGHETYQIIGENKLEFNDVEVVNEILSEK